jgi:hypothetical protein
MRVVHNIEGDIARAADNYPCLKRYKDRFSDYVVLFYAAGAGTIVADLSGAAGQVGYYSEEWAEHDFEPLPSHQSITLSND